jgi:hypothetical protein
VAVDLIRSFTLTNNVRTFEQDIRDNMHTLQGDYSNLHFWLAHRTMNTSQLKEHNYRGNESPPPKVEVVCILVEDRADQVLLAHEFASEQWDPESSGQGLLSTPCQEALVLLPEHRQQSLCS